jgi:hypothetical protein
MDASEQAVSREGAALNLNGTPGALDYFLER